MDRTYGEPIGALPVRLTDAGRADPLFGAMPAEFVAYLGHKEAVARLPEGAVLLASTDTCPVHAFRLGAHVYATQFHPELDPVAICDRIDAYSAHGYYAPHEQESSRPPLARRWSPSRSGCWRGSWSCTRALRCNS